MAPKGLALAGYIDGPSIRRMIGQVSRGQHHRRRIVRERGGLCLRCCNRHRYWLSATDMGDQHDTGHKENTAVTHSLFPEIRVG